MDKNKVIETLKKLKADSKKRKFKQTVEVIFTLKNLDLKKVDQQVEFFAIVPQTRGRASKICALVGPELKEEATKVCDKVILASDFQEYDKTKAKLLADEYDYFIAQANIMGKGKNYQSRQKQRRMCCRIIGSSCANSDHRQTRRG